MPKLTISAPAKLNLHLRVMGRRPDGFHDLESIFLALAFGDTLYFETLDEEGALEIAMKWQIEGQLGGNALFEAIPPEKNIIFRAISLFRDKTGFTQGLRVCVEKRIPLGGGLGGGSSDGASTLLALNSLAAHGSGLLDRDSLVEMGSCLGSDLPFFLYAVPDFGTGFSATAWVSGRGDRIRPLKTPDFFRSLFFVLVNPGFSSDTAGAYRLLDEFRSVYPSLDNPQPQLAEDALLRAFAASPTDWPFENDFLPVFETVPKSQILEQSEKNPPCANAGAAYRNILSQLRELGAEFAGLSGAGSTCFGVFSQQ
ncbi:MAG: 4-(cytidine 5'-diphospho)-2-C-methyl-D-erythritol kinase, partial [Treponema sp.]|nr:4-(cytidine 5'-diphospho)-2-C-methyl-D-erythritol kinase [Treponema sp.]